MRPRQASGEVKTRWQLGGHVLRTVPNAPLIEVETYAWTQLPHIDRQSNDQDIEAGIVQEILYAQACIATAQVASDIA